MPPCNDFRANLPQCPDTSNTFSLHKLLFLIGSNCSIFNLLKPLWSLFISQNIEEVGFLGHHHINDKPSADSKNSFSIEILSW